jgi:hypothetical protein
MRIFWSDLFILSCIYLDVYLVLALAGTTVNPLLNMFIFISIPIAFFIVSGSALLANRFILRSKTQKQFRFKETVVFGAKKKPKKPLIEKRVLRPLQSSKPKIEFGFHTCPVHGVEKCAGNYLDLHSCNDTVQTSSKQIFWKEITPALPAAK